LLFVWRWLPTTFKAVVKAALGSVHGIGKIDAGISNYYLVEEIQGTYRGMMIATGDIFSPVCGKPV